MKSRPKVLIAIPTNGPDGRLRLVGVLRHITRERLDWDLAIFNSRSALTAHTLDAILASGLDGCITSAPLSIAPQLVARGVPTVPVHMSVLPAFAGHARCRPVFADNAALGRLAAAKFKNLGRFASFAYIHTPERAPWSCAREAAFRAEVAHLGVYAEFPTAGEMEPGQTLEQPHSTLSREALLRFLRALPKPAAVFAANDIFAAEVHMACLADRMHIPDEVAIIGCDNDEIICHTARPNLTSLLPDFERVGMLAAKTLDALMRGRETSGPPLLVSGARLFDRATTAHVPPAVALVNHALAFIRAHACEGISTVHVVDHLRVSRSLLDLRFRQLRRRSVMDEILDARLAAVQHRLRTTRQTILRIGTECGFRSPDYLKRLFKARTGLSMRAWREQNAHHPGPGGARGRESAAPRQ